MLKDKKNINIGLKGISQMNNITYIDIRLNDTQGKRSYKFISTGTAQLNTHDYKSFSACLCIAMRNSQSSASELKAGKVKKIRKEFISAL